MQIKLLIKQFTTGFNLLKTCFMVFMVLTVSATSCKDDPPLPPAPPVPPPEEPIDTFSLTYDGPGWGRLEGIPLLGYGQPEDRRVEARAYVEAARGKLREFGWDEDYMLYANPYISLKEIGLFYPDMHRMYKNAKLNGYSKDYYTLIQTEAISNAYDYLGDTVVLFMGGGPDYGYGTSTMYLYEIVCGMDNCVGHDDYTYIPATSNVLPRAFNLDHTSIIEVPHGTAGTFTQYTYPLCNVRFFNYDERCGNFQAKWPYNVLSYEDAGLLNDISVEVLRWAVQHLKSLGKTLIFHGASWGAYIFARYLLYYPISDFERVDLFAFNPNNNKETVIKDRLNINQFHGDDIIVMGQEVYEMCRWRMLDWMEKQNLDRLRILTGGEDKNGGFPVPEEIKALTDAGATVVELVGFGHQCIYYGESKYGDTVVSQPWESNMKIYTKNGVEIIRKPDSRKHYPTAMPEEPKILPPGWVIGASR